MKNVNLFIFIFTLLNASVFMIPSFFNKDVELNVLQLPAHFIVVASSSYILIKRFGFDTRIKLTLGLFSVLFVVRLIIVYGLLKLVV